MGLKSNLAGTLLVFVTSFAVSAQDLDRVGNGHATARPPQARHDEASPSDLLPAGTMASMVEGIHPDLLMHLQEMQRYDAARDGGRAAAAEKARQRRARLAASRWYGHSPLRPTVSSIPMMGNYFPVFNSDVSRPAQWYHTRSTN